MNLSRSILLREDSPASPCQWPERERPSLMKGGYGRSLSESFAWYDRDTSSWKTSQVSLFGEWETFSKIWPYAGMMRNGICYQLEKLELPICESVSLSLPTPQARDWKGTCCQKSSLPRLLRELHARPCYPSPQLYESVMGFPVTWTELEDSETR